MEVQIKSYSTIVVGNEHHIIISNKYYSAFTSLHELLEHIGYRLTLHKYDSDKLIKSIDTCYKVVL